MQRNHANGMKNNPDFKFNFIFSVEKQQQQIILSRKYSLLEVNSVSVESYWITDTELYNGINILHVLILHLLDEVH